MSSLNKIVYLSEEQYQTLINSGTLTVDGNTITYNENDLYFTPTITTSAVTPVDEKVLNTINNSTKYYVVGTSSPTTSTGTQIFDSNIYSTTTAGELSMTICSLNSAGTEKASIQYNTTDNSIDFIFN